MLLKVSVGIVQEGSVFKALKVLYKWDDGGYGVSEVI